MTKMESLKDTNKKSVLGLKEEISFFIGNIGNIPIMTLIGTFLLIFYTDVVGLNPAAVATLFIIARVFDGFNDPLMGYVIDHLPHTKWGKFRAYLAIGSLVCSLNFVLLWVGPSLAPSGKLLIAYISYFLIGISFDLMDIPLNSLIPVMSETGRDRNILSLIKSLGYMIGTVIFSVVTIPFVMSFPTSEEGYNTLIILTSIFIFTCSFIGAAGVKERIEPISKERYKLKDLLKILSARPVSTHFLSNLISAIGSGANTAAGIYFFYYVIKKPELISIVAIFIVIGIIIGLIIGSPLLNKYGKKYTLVIGSLIAAIPKFIILLVNPIEILIIFSIFGITGIGTGLTLIVGYGLQADNTDYVEWNEGRRAEGAIASLVSFIQKAGLGIGAAIPGYILAATGYAPNVEQTHLAIQGIYWAYITIPAILGIIGALIILFGYPLTRDFNAKIARELNQRREDAKKNIN